MNTQRLPPHAGDNDWVEAIIHLLMRVSKHQPEEFESGKREAISKYGRFAEIIYEIVDVKLELASIKL